MTQVIGFDVYGTLVDPSAMREHLAALTGPEQSDRAAAMWRAKQLDHAFRAALMRKYVDFSVCTRRALEHTLRSLACSASEAQINNLLDRYLKLPAFPDVENGLAALRDGGTTLVAFSNGTEQAVRSVLENAGLAAFFVDVVSVDDLQTYKPDPVVYSYLVQRGGSTSEETWLVSANDWDVTGAGFAGLRTAWVRRDARSVFDSSGVEPDIVVPDIGKLASALPQ